MNLSYGWLKELLPDAPPVSEVADLLPQLGLGVESVTDLAAPPSGVVVARVEEVKEIEGSDHLKACTVTDGSSSYSVVCGAPNVRAGMLSALAKPGVHLPGAGFTVEKRKLMGVASEGVLCSPKELSLYDYGGGLIEFGDDAPVGTELAELWQADTVLDVEITPNRADALSVLGIARDLAAKLGTAYKLPWENLELGKPKVDDGLTVKLEDPVGCPRFTLRRIDGVTVKPSPVWMQQRLAAVGLRPRNNIVDITNYVTYETGHPSHAYDLDNVNDNTIVVRRANEGESVLTLGEENLELTPEDIAITMPYEGGTKVIGVAGVIGGMEDSIHPTTQNVALELAHWNPALIRKTAKRHGQFTDAHYRFERGVDQNLPPLASARASQLIADLAGGTVHEGVTDIGEKAELKKISYRPSRVKKLTTLDVPLDRQVNLLEALGCKVEQQREDNWLVTAPSWRFDLGIEEDLVEEVSRLYGYEHIGESVPKMYFVPEESDATHQRLRLLLAGLGLQETMTYAFSSDAELTKANAPASHVQLSNPQGVERSVLRTALYPGLLQAAVQNKQRSSLALFEVGHVFLEDELERLCILLRGPWSQGGWQKGIQTDFYVFKGLLEKLAHTLGVALTFKPADVAYLHPGVSASVIWQGKAVGYMGQLHPEVAARYDLDTTFIAELDLPLNGAELAFTDYNRQPHAERDLSVIVPKELSYHALAELVKGAAGEWLESIQPFDVYEGHPVPEGKKSLAIRLWFRRDDRALRDEELDGYVANIITALSPEGYTIRDR